VTAPKEVIHLKTVTVDGITFYVFEDKEEAEALIRVARNSLFMGELQRRSKNVAMIGGVFTAFLIFMSQWWPAIDAAVRAILKGIPNG
jgi:phosphopantetheine adenylyltransferase